MTMPEERTRSLLWAGAFLIEIAHDEKLPLAIRRRAVVIARHFPTVEDVTSLSLTQPLEGLGVSLCAPDEVQGWAEECRFQPLLRSTRLVWLEDEGAERP